MTKRSQNVIISQRSYPRGDENVGTGGENFRLSIMVVAAVRNRMYDYAIANHAQSKNVPDYLQLNRNIYTTQLLIIVY
jgi:hypothetical protein